MHEGDEMAVHLAKWAKTNEGPSPSSLFLVNAKGGAHFCVLIAYFAKCADTSFPFYSAYNKGG